MPEIVAAAYGVLSMSEKGHVAGGGLPELGSQRLAVLGKAAGDAAENRSGYACAGSQRFEPLIDIEQFEFTPGSEFSCPDSLETSRG